MKLETLLAPDRAKIVDGPLGRTQALQALSELLASGGGVDASEVFRVLQEREQLQSTGLGDGVAIPHGALSHLAHERAALLIAPAGVEFDAIDDQKVRLFVAVVGPRSTSGEHLRILARISRILRSRALRERLIRADSAKSAYDALLKEDQA